MSGDTISVDIPRNIHDKVKQRVELSKGQYKNVEEYIALALEKALRESKDEAKVAYTPEEEKKVRKRLKDLGYL